jgi:hypothetical protein
MVGADAPNAEGGDQVITPSDLACQSFVARLEIPRAP